MRRRAFLKQAVLSGASLPFGGLLASAIVAPASAQVITTTIGSFTTTIGSFTTTIGSFTTTIGSFTTTTGLFTTTDFFTTPPGGTSEPVSVPEPSSADLLITAAGVWGAASLMKRLRAAAGTEAPSTSEGDKSA